MKRTEYRRTSPDWYGMGRGAAYGWLAYDGRNVTNDWERAAARKATLAHAGTEEARAAFVRGFLDYCSEAATI